MRKRHQRTRGRNKHPRKRGDRKHLRKRGGEVRLPGEEDGSESRRALGYSEDIWEEGSQDNEGSDDSRDRMDNVGIDLDGDFRWTTTTRSSCALVHGRSIYAVSVVAWAFESMEFPVG
ncbi:unnamed protein product [Ectocarpus sp. 4 AP-2014]